MRKKFKRIILILIVISLTISSVPAARASVADLSTQFVGYNLVSGTVVNGVYLRGAPYFSTDDCPVYFYKINGNIIYIAPGKSITVIEREEDYFYIAYHYNGTYYCGYVPVGDISCSGYSWSNHDIRWPGLYNGIPEDGSRIQNVCYGPGDASYFLRWSSVNVDSTVSTLLLRKTNRYAFIQHMIYDGNVLKYVRGWVWGSYINPWPNMRPDFVPFFYFDSQIVGCPNGEKNSYDNAVYILNRGSGKALTVSSSADETILTVTDFNGSLNQQFCLVETGHNPSTYKLYSQYANKFVEVDHSTSEGAFLRLRSSISGGGKDEFATMPWSWEHLIDDNTVIGVRSSGFYRDLTVDSSNRVIMKKREWHDGFFWDIVSINWDGDLDFRTIDNYGYSTVRYKIDSSITTSTPVTPAMVRRAADYWNECAEANIDDHSMTDDFTLISNSSANYFTVKYVNQSQAPTGLKNSYAYFDAKNSDDKSILDQNGYYVYYDKWYNVQLCIIREKVANLTDDEIVKVIAHEFGHCLKMPHTAVNNNIESALNTGNFYMFPDFDYSYTSTSGNFTSDYDRYRLATKQY